MDLLKLPFIVTLVYAVNFAGRPPVSPSNPKPIYKREPERPLYERVFAHVGPILTLCLWIESIIEVAFILLCGVSTSWVSGSSGILTCETNTRYRISANYIVGWVLIICGTVLRKACYKELGRLFTFVIGIQKDHRLVTTGPYSVVRHPAYAAFVLINAGLMLVHVDHQPVPVSHWTVEAFMCFYDWFYIAVSAAATVFLLGRAEPEEKELRDEFGDAWVRWAKRVPYKFVPGIW
ncbi:hypothetical protein BJ165DRAFT_1405702 [Panaeolus papilionaceus]|nr:hypothetical protein BJ165DRAFT_1405702 [Panaeolus papilionaceus]